jgi:hypothetical protein
VVHDVSVRPHWDGETAARTAPIAGVGPNFADPLIAAAQADLAPAIAAADTAALAAWEQRHRARITRAVHGALAQAQMHLHEAVRLIRTREHLR